MNGKKNVAFVDFSPDGKRLVTAGRSNVQIWDATIGSQLLELGEPRTDDPKDNAFSTAARFSPDGRRVAMVTGDLLRIWSIPDASSLTQSGRAGDRFDDSPSGGNTKQPTGPATKEATPAAPEFLTSRIGAIKLKRVPAGMFLMGSPKEHTEADLGEKPQRKVQITRPFYLGVYEVTQAQYRAVTSRSPSWFSSTGGGKELVSGPSADQYPVESVSWLDAVKFCNALSEKEGVKPFYALDGGNASVPDWARDRLPAANRSGVGICLPCRHAHEVVFR